MDGKDERLTVFIMGDAARAGFSGGEGLRLVRVRGAAGDGGGRPGPAWNDELVLKVERRENILSFFAGLKSLPLGLTTGNSPLRVSGDLGPLLDSASPKAVVVLDSADWISVCILPWLMDALLAAERKIEVHFLCSTQINSGVPVEERYLARAKIYGGVRELLLMAARLGGQRGVNWCVWDILPNFQSPENPLWHCLGFLAAREEVLKVIDPHAAPELLESAGGQLYPRVCKGAGFVRLPLAERTADNGVSSAALRRLREIIRKRSAQFPSGWAWNARAWKLRPRLFSKGAQLETYLAAQVWKPSGLNELMELTLERQVRALEAEAARLLPGWEPAGADILEEKPVEAAAALCRKMDADALLFQDLSQNLPKAAELMCESAFFRLAGSEPAALGAGLDGLLDEECIAGKLSELAERRTFVRLESVSVQDAVSAVLDFLGPYRNDGRLLVKDNGRNRQKALEDLVLEYNGGLRNALGELNRAVAALIRVRTMEALERLLSILARSAAAVKGIAYPAGWEDGPGGQAERYEDLLAEAALFRSPFSSWEEFWDHLWEAMVLETSGEEPADARIVTHLALLAPAGTDDPCWQNRVAEAAQATGIPVERLSAALSSQGGVEESMDGGFARKMRGIEEREAYALARKLVRESVPRCRCVNAEARSALLVAGALSPLAKMALERECSPARIAPLGADASFKAVAVAETEAFGFDRLFLLREYAGDWLAWAESLHRESSDQPCCWTPMGKLEAMECSRLESKARALFRRLASEWEAGKLDWDASGRLSGNSPDLPETLADWIAAMWRLAPGASSGAGAQGAGIGEDAVLPDPALDSVNGPRQEAPEKDIAARLGSERLRALAELFRLVPFLGFCLPDVRADSMEKVFAGPRGRNVKEVPKNLWIFQVPA